MPVSRLARLGSWCYRRRRTVLATWVAALAATLILVAPLAGEFKTDFNTPGSDSAAAEALLSDRFDDRSAETIDVVWHAAAGARSPEQDGDRAPAGRRPARRQRPDPDR